MTDINPDPTFEEIRQRLALSCQQIREAVSAGEGKISTYAIAVFELLRRSALPREKQREILSLTDALIQTGVQQSGADTMTEEGNQQNTTTENGDGQSEADTMTELGDEQSETGTVTLAGDEQSDADRARDIEEEVYTLTSLAVLYSEWPRAERRELLKLVDILREQQVEGITAE